MPSTGTHHASARSFLWHYIRPHMLRIIALFIAILATIALGILAPMVAGEFIDRVIEGAPQRDLLELAGITLLIALGAQVFAILETWLAEDVAWRSTNRLRLDLLDHLLGLDAKFHAAHPAGELIARVDGDVGSMASMFSRFTVSVLGNGLMILAVLGVLFWTDFAIASIVAAIVVVTFTVLIYLQRVARPRWEANQQMVGEFTGLIGEYVAGADDIRTSAAVPWAMRNHAELLRRWLPIRIRSEIMGYYMGSATSGAIAVALLIAVVMAVFRVQNGSLTIGSVFLITRLITMVNDPISRLRNELQQLQQASAGFIRVRELLAIRSRVEDRGMQALPAGSLELTFDHISFGYDADRPVLKDVSFTIPAGSVMGIVGRTGSGKTSITRLIPRLYDPDHGAVRVNDTDIREFPLESLRRRIGVVTQDVHLMHGTLRDNLTLFDPSINDDRILESLQVIGMGDWLQMQPLGLDTIVGSEGANLSAGEAQLLTCIRALLRDPDIVILDEASARLDPATDRLLHKALRTLLHNRTAVLVAHRMSTLSFADRIVVLDRGVVIESGMRVDLENNPESRFAHLMRQAHEEDLA